MGMAKVSGNSYTPIYVIVSYIQNSFCLVERAPIEEYDRDGRDGGWVLVVHN